jgi:stage V sporulation protein G
MKVVEGAKGVFLCMPSRKLPDGTHKDMVHPVNQEFRQYLEESILKAYQQELLNNPQGTENKICSEVVQDVK